MPRKRQNEDALLRKIAESSRSSRSKTPWRSVALGIGDDAALFQPKPGHQTILTCDWFLEGTHFLRDKHPPDSAGWKCLARAVSDVAAMGGTPRCFLLSLALPEAKTGRWLDAFLAGLRRASRKFQCPLAGGDTTRREEILINVTVVGEVRAGSAVLRSGARPGDILYVSGQLGAAEMGLRLLRAAKSSANYASPAIQKHLYPQPRIALGNWLAENGRPSALMDLSDGLSTDLSRLCHASSVGARIDASKLPIFRPAAGLTTTSVRPLELALHGGDDYELLFTAAPKQRIPGQVAGVRLSAIGTVTKRKQILLVGRDGSHHLLKPAGWDPFRKKL